MDVTVLQNAAERPIALFQRHSAGHSVLDRKGSRDFSQSDLARSTVSPGRGSVSCLTHVPSISFT